MTRLFWKVFLALWLSIIGFAVVTVWVNEILVQQHFSESPEAAYVRGAERAERMISNALSKGGKSAARDALGRLPRFMLNHVYVLDQNDRELLGRDRVRRHIGSDRVQHKSSEIRDQGGNTYQLIVLRRAPPARILEPGTRGIFIRLLVAAFIAAFVSYFLARYLSRPLETLGVASRQLAKGDLSARVGSPLDGRKDEFGGLARDLDEMAGHLQRQQRANRRLLRDVSHELRSPLARLRVALEIARNRGIEDVSSELDRIDLEGQRLDELIEEVLTLQRETSQSVPLSPETFNLAEFIEDLGEAVAYEVADSETEIRVKAPPGLKFTGDRELLWRALENLLRNAFLHSPQGALVELNAEKEQINDVLEITILDDGPGVPEQDLPRIFDAFFRVDEARNSQTGGHGLGLAIAASAIRRHSGTISASNRDNGGLCVTVRLPLSPPTGQSV